ncbi:unnamed protein product [Calypogeia fissa]
MGMAHRQQRHEDRVEEWLECTCMTTRDRRMVAYVKRGGCATLLHVSDSETYDLNKTITLANARQNAFTTYVTCLAQVSTAVNTRNPFAQVNNIGYEQRGVTIHT